MDVLPLPLSPTRALLALCAKTPTRHTGLRLLARAKAGLRRFAQVAAGSRGSIPMPISSSLLKFAQFPQFPLAVVR